MSALADKRGLRRHVFDVHRRRHVTRTKTIGNAVRNAAAALGCCESDIRMVRTFDGGVVIDIPVRGRKSF